MSAFPGSTPWYQDPNFWYQGAGLLADVYGQYAGRQAGKKANEQNIMLSREQRQWEEMMSNSAVQRRANDIEKAGGNRALAFTNGQEASTPSYSPAHVEPTTRAGDYNFTGKAMAMMQMQQIQAQTKLTTAQARVANVEADIREGGKGAEFERRVNRNVEEYEWDNIKTRLLRNQEKTTGVEAANAEARADALLRQAKAMARTQELNLSSLEAFAKTFGEGASQNMGMISQLFNILKVLFGKD